MNLIPTNACRIVTKMSTLVERLAIIELVDGPAAYVAGTNEWKKARQGIDNAADTEACEEKLLSLAQYGLETCSRMKFCTRLKQAGGLFEIRKAGVRFYGGRLGRLSERDILLLLGAEDKQGESKANTALLARCSEDLKQYQETFRAKLGDQSSRPRARHHK